MPGLRWAIRTRPITIGIAAVLLTVCLAYSNILFRGETLVSSSNYHPFDIFSTVIRPLPLKGSSIVNWHDQGAVWWQWEPAGKFFSHQMRQGSFPLWDPFTGGGVNSHVSLTQGQYFPPYLLLLLSGDTPLQRDLYYLMLLFLSGLCCFWYAHRKGLHPIASSAMAASWMLTGSVTQNINSELGQSFLVLPFMVLAADWFLDRPGWRRLSLAALALAVATLTSFLPIVLSGYLLIACLTVVRALTQVPLPMVAAQNRRSESTATHRAATTGSGILQAPRAFTLLWKSAVLLLLSAALVAFLLIPVLNASRLDANFQTTYAPAGLQSYEFDDLLTLVSPSVSYDVWQTSSPLFPLPHTRSALFFYAGLIPILLIALVAFPARGARRTALVFLAGAAALLFLKLLGIAPAQWLGYLPFYRMVHFIPYFCGALAFAISGLAAMGIDSLIARRPSWSRIAVLAALVASFFILVARFATVHPMNPQTSPTPFFREVTRLGFLALGLFGIVVFRRINASGRVAGMLAFTLILADLLPLAYHGRFRRSDVWEHPPDYVHFLQQDASLFRVHGVHDLALTANVSQGAGLAAISSRTSFNPPRFATLLRQYFDCPDPRFPLATSLLPNTRGVLDLLNVKYLIAFEPPPEQDAALRAAGLEPAHAGRSFRIYRNLSVWPRAFVTNRYALAASPETALRAVGNSRQEEVILERKPSFLPGPASPGRVETTDYRPNRVTISLTAPEPSILVLLDSYSPGWTATVNGQPAELLVANYAFRGVEVPAGQSTVVFRYFPPGLWMGLLVSGIAVLLAIVLLVGGRRRHVARDIALT